MSTIEKDLLSSNISFTCPHNMVKFDPLAAEIGPVVWGTPVHINGFRVLEVGSVTARHCSIGRQPNFAALNGGRHLYWAGRPSRWALAHILVSCYYCRRRCRLLRHVLYAVHGVSTVWSARREHVSTVVCWYRSVATKDPHHVWHSRTFFARHRSHV